jgi:malonate decarboxylase epsilon subunit
MHTAHTVCMAYTPHKAMMKALLCPGQGAQSPGYLRQLPDHPAVRLTLQEASAALGREILTLDSAAALTSTIAAQLTLVTASVAAARALAAEGVTPDLAAGLSVGAFAAAVICDALDFADALRLVELRAQLMEQAYPSGYGLAALTGLNELQVYRLIEQLEVPVYLANLNAARQIVVAGSDAGLAALIELALKHGARRAERLAVSVPSHCELLAHAAQTLSAAAAQVAFRTPRIPYLANRNARALRTAEPIRDDLATNLRYPVRWADTVRLMYELGTRVFIETPPGQVLSALVSDSFPDATVVTLSTQTLARAVATVKARAADRSEG